MTDLSPVESTDLDAAKAFMAGHARALDRHRLGLLLGEGEAARALTALGAYRNPDGGFGWGLEPDLRSVSSQPAGAMHAMEVFAECGSSVTSRRAIELCDWLQRRTLADGGLPLALPVDDPAGSSPIWTRADPSVSTLQMTSQVAAHAHRLAPHQPEVAKHPWLAAATRYCLEEIRRMDRVPQAHELMFSIAFLDAAAPRLPEADELLGNLGRHIPDDGVVRVQGGTEDEALHPTHLSPWPELPSRRLLREHVIEADLDGRL